MSATTTLTLDSDLEQRVRRLADAQQLTPDRLMHEAIADYVQRAEAREAFMKEAQESLQAFQETGLHLMGSEVEAWLAGWGTAVETEAPACRR